ncbi:MULTISPECIES: MerR family transcriptional regulator [unclassified Herbaspirillum]|jgi:DNA-binding transcriptional MerR regulator|uniref:MerR family transcriptional regulator n=1 Tax=unclassified Herbaspirillum TaxID=2624150 RepID=UPI000E2FB759|nr:MULTISPECIES: MerR family transcriptional regulator [unclassified Herbaspirillum]RFB73792.1 MerR family transcriptional regulator [Herbaspirillum sp. 3R-3a1]TFI10397.1 MerR family transcriptional regulator [Herbaspirillum sp. 3R11]TFI16302.1 MerR family transcriptional regulator [Herbaspirillum sp. 3R-11]TFI20113.1 MerR family transcriptional regulator [Herbaspirillum sp. 3C11]
MNERVNKPAVIVLPPIPAKRYFTIGEVSELCGVKPHVLRYWEQEFTQLKPVKRRGNRRYYQHHEVLLIRRIRELLYEQGFTISGARNKLDGHLHEDQSEIAEDIEISMGAEEIEAMRAELNGILQLLGPRA